MKKIFLLVLCLALCCCAAALAEGDKLYYNPDGGQYYHTDAMCSSIAYKYRPLTATLTESELNAEAYINLKPCATCDAPERPAVETVADTEVMPPVEYDVAQSLNTGSEAMAAANSILLTTGEYTEADIESVCAADLTLYYNPKGGERYHTEISCPSVSDQYLPLAGTMTYKDLLKAKYSKLEPCTICVSPAKPTTATLMQVCAYEEQTEDDNGHWVVTYTRNSKKVCVVTLDESNGLLVSLSFSK